MTTSDRIQRGFERFGIDAADLVAIAGIGLTAALFVPYDAARLRAGFTITGASAVAVLRFLRGLGWVSRFAKDQDRQSSRNTGKTPVIPSNSNTLARYVRI